MIFFAWHGVRSGLFHLAGVLVSALILFTGDPAIAAASREDDRAVLEFISKITVRAYAGNPATQLRYLGITRDGRVFGLGDFTNQTNAVATRRLIGASIRF